jgi:hypothetical protein
VCVCVCVRARACVCVCVNCSMRDVTSVTLVRLSCLSHAFVCSVQTVAAVPHLCTVLLSHRRSKCVTWLMFFFWIGGGEVFRSVREQCDTLSDTFC